MKRQQPTSSITRLLWLAGMLAAVGCGGAGDSNATDTLGKKGQALISAPDLVITSLSGPPSAASGGAFTATVKVCNVGTAGSTTARLELYLSTTATVAYPPTPPPSSQVLIGSLDVPGMMNGQCVTRTVPANATIPAGAPPDAAYYLGGIIDANQAQAELREDNNAFVGGLIGVGNRSDLVVTRLSAPASVRAGNAFVASVTVCNQGTSSTMASNIPVELYLSTVPSLTQPGMGVPPPPTQTFLGAMTLSWLAAGQCTTRSLTVNATLPPAATGDGAYTLGAIVDTYRAETELREDNNIFLSGLMGVGSRSDLVITQLSAPPSVTPGSPFTASLTACNQGTTPTNSSNIPVELYLSTVASLTTPPPATQRMIGSTQLPMVIPGRCITVDVNVSAQLPPAATGDGAYTLGAIVDPYGTEQELREDNNVFLSGLMGVGSRSDLVVTRVSAPPSATQGGAFTASVTVCNQGTSTTGASNLPVEVYLSTVPSLIAPVTGGPGAPPSSQMLLGAFSLSYLAAGQCTTRDLQVNANPPPEATPDTALYVGALVDPYGYELELREDNNAFVGGLIGVGTRPDLVITQLSAPPSVRMSSPFTASVTVCNQGTAWTNSNNLPVELYLSTVPSLTMPGMGAPPPSTQTLLGSVPLPSFAPGQCVTRSLTMNAYLPPDGTGDGAYTLGAIVDPYRAETELREDNNVFLGGLIGVGNRSDLVVTQVSGPPSVMPGASFTATVTVCNQGTAMTSASLLLVDLYLSTTPTLTVPSPASGPPPNTQSLLGSLSLTALDVGQCTTRTVTVSAYAPPPTSPLADRAYYLGAIVDSLSNETELREDNNTFTGGLVGVGTSPDLVVTQVTGPASVRTGTSFTAVVTVCNQGTYPMSYTALPAELYLSTTPTLSVPSTSGPGPMNPNQMRVGILTVPQLAAGQCTTQTVQAYADLPSTNTGDGAYYLGAIVDPNRSEPELREDNNTFVAGLIGVGNRSDLVVTQVSGPPSVRINAPFTASVTVCNRGTAAVMSSNVPVELYISTVPSITPPQAAPSGPPPTSQLMVGYLVLTPLDAGQCITRTMNAYAYLPSDAGGLAGVYSLGAVVDSYRQELELREDNNISALTSLFVLP
ncbi:hypothetical protein KRR26_03125 [Corallococcus sp. M34]|uniref:CARDB domain-containing protein n=1 Tax=Citreicoccus inhibens TaxID=2849499 RepID=UPI001C2322B6|nr:CARDB domain-containing protein [Citreicoccus inhibens]MBU8894577.1 hypothetical protein [Citreicoccus inhibens]